MEPKRGAEVLDPHETMAVNGNRRGRVLKTIAIKSRFQSCPALEGKRGRHSREIYDRGREDGCQSGLWTSEVRQRSPLTNEDHYRLLIDASMLFGSR